MSQVHQFLNDIIHPLSSHMSSLITKHHPRLLLPLSFPCWRLHFYFQVATTNPKFMDLTTITRPPQLKSSHQQPHSHPTTLPHPNNLSWAFNTVKVIIGVCFWQDPSAAVARTISVRDEVRVVIFCVHHAFVFYLPRFSDAVVVRDKVAESEMSPA